MSYVLGDIVVVFLIRYMTVSLDIPKMPPPVMMFNRGQGWEGIRNGPFLYIITHVFFSYLLRHFS